MQRKTIKLRVKPFRVRPIRRVDADRAVDYLSDAECKVECGRKVEPGKKGHTNIL